MAALHPVSALRADDRARFRVPILALFLLLVLGNPLHTRGAAQTPDSLIDPAILPDQQSAVAAAIPDDLPVYTIQATFNADDTDPTIDGTVSLDYVNTTGDVLDEIPLRLYANAASERNDAITLGDVTVGGVAVEPELSIDDSVATLPLAGMLADGDRTTIDLSFNAAVPVDTTAHYGIFGVDSKDDTWALAHWYPILAGRDPDRGWMLDPTSRNGDPIFSTTSLYDVTITTPKDWALITSGVEREESAASDGDLATHQFVTGPARDFTVVADDNAESVTRDVDGVTVRSWYNPGQADVGNAVADYAASSLEMFSGLLSPYPYRELDLVAVPLNGAAGVEFPGLIYVGGSYYDQSMDFNKPNFLEFTVAHEVVHQWFYGLVGNNQYDHAFIDEGLTNFLSSIVYFTDMYDERAANTIFDRAIRNPYEATIRRGDDQVVDQPTDGFPSENAYVFAAYAKAPIGFATIYAAIGDEAFLAALRQYVAGFTFLIATPDDLLAAFEDNTDVDVRAIWTRWFESADSEATPHA